MYLNSSISVAPQEADKALSSNGAITSPIKYFPWAAGLLGSVELSRDSFGGR